MLRDIFSIGFVTLMLSAVFYTLIVDIYGIGSPLRDSYSANQKMILKRSTSVRRNVYMVASAAGLGLSLLVNKFY